MSTQATPHRLSILTRNSCLQRVHDEVLTSTELIFRSRLTLLLIFGPIALVGKAGLFGESTCFVLAGLCLIPLAERLSFVTEEVACHTNQTIGALLNATFGNAPELLISAAALQEGFYRVVQLALLGSMLTNLLFVFGLSCLVGGLRFQVQELRVVSGNASVGMLALAVAGLALPAALLLSDEAISRGAEEKEYVDKNGDGISDINDGPSASMVGFSRFNAVIMIAGYLLYLLFQLGSHRDEFEDPEEEDAGAGEGDTAGRDEEGQAAPRSPRGPAARTERKARPNKFCQRLFGGCRDGADSVERAGQGMYQRVAGLAAPAEVELPPRIPRGNDKHDDGQSRPDRDRQHALRGETNVLPQSQADLRPVNRVRSADSGDVTVRTGNLSNRSRVEQLSGTPHEDPLSGREHTNLEQSRNAKRTTSNKSHCSDGPEEEPYVMRTDVVVGGEDAEETHMSFRAGLFWLFIITISISAMSDILVDTIDGFAFRYGISEVFTSLVILPYFSNIAEQVSALIFAYRNEMDLCIGISIGSAVQIALFVLPGSVLIGWAMDRSMSLFFRGFETCCLIFSVVSVAAVLQGGTTNWLVGAYLLGVYFMVAAGFWFHELENLTVDGELVNLHNHTGT